MSTVLIPSKEKFLNEWDTNWGLIYNIHIFTIICFVLVSLIGLQIIPNKPMLILNIIFTPNIIFLFFWLTRRSYLDLAFSRKLNVVFVIDLENNSESAHKIYKETLDNLRAKIIENNLEKTILIKGKPEDISFKTKTAAEAKTRMGLPGSVLLVWGSILENSKKFKVFFSYEFGYPGKEKEYYKNLFQKKVDKVLAQKLWPYMGPQSIDLLSDDFLEVSYFILGLSMASLGFFDKSIVLFKSFIKNWKQSTDLIKKRNLGFAVKEAEGVLAKIYINYAELSLYKENYKKVNEYAQYVLDIDYDNDLNYSAFLFLAISSEIGEDNTEKAKEYSTKAENIHPSKKEVHLFNKAYFLFKEYDLKSALDIYDQLAKWEHHINYNETRSILFKQWEKTHNLGLFFAEAFVALIFQKDSIYGKKKLKEFIKRAEKSKDSKDYSILVSRAKSLIIN